MGLEAGTYLNDLVVANPDGAIDPKSEGDNHLRLIKTVLKNTFPGMTGVAWRFVTKSSGYTVQNTDNNVMFQCTGSFTLGLSAVAVVGNGFMIAVTPATPTIAVTIDPNGAELINNSTTLTVRWPYTAYLFSSGVGWVAVVGKRSAERHQGPSIASAATIDFTAFLAEEGDYHHITGTTGINTVTLVQGQSVDVVFDGALQLFHGASLILPSGAIILTAAGDSATFRGEASGVVRCLDYTRADGRALVATTSPVVAAVTEKTAGFTVTNADSGTIFECSGTFVVSFDALSTFSASFYVWIINKGTGVVTLDPSTTELIQMPGGNQVGDLTTTLPYSSVNDGPFNISGVLLYKNSDGTPKWGVALTRETHGYKKVLMVPTTVTVTIAAPAVMSWATHGFENGQPIVLSTTGALPTGLAVATTYYVVNKAASTFELSATPGGASITTTGSQSGVHTGTPQWVAPVGVTAAWVTGTAGGGGGGGAQQVACGDAFGGGGASGDWCLKTQVACVPGTAYTTTIGNGGTAGVSGAGTGGTGGTTSLGGLLSLTGGSGGVGANAVSALGGAPSGLGQNGFAGTSTAAPGRVLSATLIAHSGYGGKNIFGVNTVGVVVGNAGTNAVANSGSGASGGAALGGSSNRAGGVGGSGQMVIEW